jgi:RNA polymerase-binding transcription factor DksA
MRELDGARENADHLLEEIEAALGRIEAGTYGLCTSCGRPIAPSASRPFLRDAVHRRQARGGEWDVR